MFYFYGLATAAIVVLLLFLGYGIRAAQCRPCAGNEQETMDEIEEMQMRGW